MAGTFTTLSRYADLGRTVRTYRPKAWRAFEGAISMLAVSVLALGWYMLAERPSGKLLVLGLAGIVSSLVMFLLAVYRSCKVLYVCENGIRFAGMELAWDQIDAVTINRSGPVTYGAHTSGYWDVRILGRNGTLIRLTETFLSHLSNRDELLSILAPYVRT